MIQLLDHSDEVGSTVILDGGTKLYCGAGTSVVMIKPDGTWSEISREGCNHLIEGQETDCRKMTPAEEHEWHEARYGQSTPSRYREPVKRLHAASLMELYTKSEINDGATQDWFDLVYVLTAAIDHLADADQSVLQTNYGNRLQDAIDRLHKKVGSPQ